jgi:hypothetical protein
MRQCDEQIASFVDQELTHHYGRMIKFVETVKAKLAQTASPREINVDKGTATHRLNATCVECSWPDSSHHFFRRLCCTDMCEKLIEDFGATWKAVFVQLSGEVMNFSNFIKGYDTTRPDTAVPTLLTTYVVVRWRV